MASSKRNELDLKVFLKNKSITEYLTMISFIEDRVNENVISTRFSDSKQSKLDAYFN